MLPASKRRWKRPPRRAEDILPLMNTDKHRFLFKEETHQIIGCSFDVLNELGHGLLEKPYENQEDISEYQSLAPASDKKYQTFCGT